MKFEIGDAVALKSTGEEGILRSMDAKKNMAEVQINGIVFPVHLDALEHPYLNLFLKQKFVVKPTQKKHIDSVPVEKSQEKNATIAFENYGVHLVFVPIYNPANFDLDSIERAKVYLVNNTHEAFSFTYNFKNNNGQNFSIQSEVHSLGNFYIHNIEYEDLATGPYFELIGAQQLQKASTKLLQFEQNFQLKPKKLFQYIQEMQNKNTALFGIPVLQYEPDANILAAMQRNREAVKSAKSIAKTEKIAIQAATEKEIIETKIAQLKNVANKQAQTATTPKPIQAVKPKYNLVTHFANPFEVDLHIEKLVPQEVDIPHDAKLTLQLEYFLKALENAIINKQDRLVVIHGLGKGVLKAEIHGILNQTKEVHSYVNEYSHKFGFGSTEIFFNAKTE